HVERVVGMDVRKFACVEDLAKPSASKTVVVGALQVLQADDANHSALAADGPGLEFAGVESLQCFLDGHLGAQCFCGIAHRLRHQALPSSCRVSALGRWMPSCCASTS